MISIRLPNDDYIDVDISKYTNVVLLRESVASFSGIPGEKILFIHNFHIIKYYYVYTYIRNFYNIFLNIIEI